METKTESPRDERLSAYLDGELTEAERHEVEQRLAEDAEARRLVEEFTELRDRCGDLPRGVFSEQLADRVLAEARRRAASGEDMPTVAPTERLEPEGEFGLPFGRSPRSWVWAGVAAAAAVMIAFYGRPEPAPRNPVAQRGPSVMRQASPESFAAYQRFKQAVPHARLVNLTTSPQGLNTLEELLRRRGIELAVRPPQGASSELEAAQRSGLVVDPRADTAAGEQLMLISGSQRLTQDLVSDLESQGSMFKVEAEPATEPPQSGPSAKQPQQVPIAVRIRPAPGMQVSGEALQPIKVAPGRTPIVLRIVVVRKQQPGQP